MLERLTRQMQALDAQIGAERGMASRMRRAGHIIDRTPAGQAGLGANASGAARF
jgi:hypothetical protein